MASSSFLKQILAGFANALQPLRDAVASPAAFTDFLKQFGWTLPNADVTALTGALKDVSTLAANPSALSVDQLAKDLVAASTLIRGISPSGAPAAFVSTFPRELLDYLVYQAVGTSMPPLFGLLHFVGVFTERRVAADSTTGRADHVEVTVHWDRLGALAEQPLQTIASTYGWGATFDGDALIRSLGILARGLGARAGIYPADHPLANQYYAPGSPAIASLKNVIVSLPALDAATTTTGASAKLACLAVPIPPNATAIAPADGVAVMPVITGRASDTIALSDSVSLKLNGDVLARPVRAEFHPGRAALRAAAGDAHVDTSARLDAKAAPAAPWILIGNSDSSRLELSAAHAAFGLTGTLDGDVELKAEIGLDAAALVIDFGESDGLLQETVSRQPTRSAFSFTLNWSSKTGFAIGGQPKLQVSLPVHQSIGGLASLQKIDLALGSAGGKSVALDAMLTAAVSIGPVNAVISDVGTRLLLTSRDATDPPGNLGNLDLDFDFKPPTGIGLSIDTQGVVSGGGFLFHDPVQSLYAGVMQLSISDAFTLTAFGLIATKMPDGSPGYSLIIFMTAEDFRPIPLGMGFTLQGIGGMVAVNRTFDQDVLRAGMQNDTLKTLLFPRDPVTNAPTIIRSLASAFPAKRGSYLLGILARIGWFTPTLIQLDLALILEFGARKRLLVLGRISALLPSPDNDLVRINLDAIGVLDFDQDTASIDAKLIDSRLAKKFVLTGDAALRAGWGSGPHQAFVLAVGGFNPRFAPPAGVPPLDRVAIALSSGNNPRLTCEAYFALTANTIQFGARAALYAEACSFSIAGDIGFDVLISRAPLHFIADYHASVQLKYGSHNLFKVSVEGSLEGPRPLRVSGKATFEIFWCDFSVRFDKKLIDGDPPPPPPAIDVLAELNRALATAQSWSTQVPTGRGHGVALRKLAPGTALVLDPLGRLAIKQDVVPLNSGRDIDVFGGAPVAGARRFALAAALNNVDLTQVTALQAPFAPAQFFAMSDDEKLAAPSFQQMEAGFVVGNDDAVTIDAAQLVAAPLEYDSIIIDTLAGDVPPKQPAPYVLPAAQLAVHAATGAAARAPVRRVGRARFRTPGQPAVELAAPAWAIAPLDGGPPVAVAATVKTWSEYQGALTNLNRAGASFQLVPATALAA
jgi:Family of unknown function (DUF6603)